MSNIPGYQHRVISLRILIASSLTRLQDFIASPLFAGIDPSEQERLQRQVKLMLQLTEVLQERIDFFPEANRRVDEARVTSTADIRAALTKEIPLDTIGPIVSTDMHPTMGRSDFTDPANCFSFWGRFTYEGLALQEIPLVSLRQHLLHAMSPARGHAAGMPPAGYIGVVALKVEQ